MMSKGKSLILPTSSRAVIATEWAAGLELFRILELQYS
jgi:hypothetical protein